MADKPDLSPEQASFAANKKLVTKLSDPAAMVHHLSSNTALMAKTAPSITQGLHQAVMSGQQFLQSKLPLPQTSLPLSREHVPSRSQIAKFNSYVSTVNDPLSVFEHVKHGTLRGEHMEALQAVYPKLFEEMRHKVVEHMDLDKAKSLPNATKIALAKFMGRPMDASMLPQSIAANQAALTGPKLGSQAQAGKTTLGGLKELKGATRAATESETLDPLDN